MSSPIDFNYFSSLDNDLRKKLFDGRIPVVFTLAAEELASLNTPHALYMMVPRQSYFTLFIDHIKNHFQSFVATSMFSSLMMSSYSDAASTPTCGNPLSASMPSVNASSISNSISNIWFEFDGIPLKWNLPIGVLFDVLFCGAASAAAAAPSSAAAQQSEPLAPGSLLARAAAAARQKSFSSISTPFSTVLNHHLPWQITVHFSNFPTAAVPRCDKEEDIQWSYINALKEAMFARYGTTKPIMTLSKPNQVRLWNAVKETNMPEYDKVIATMIEENQLITKAHAIRVYTSTGMRQGKPSRLFCPQRDSLQSKRLGEFLLENLVDMFPNTDSLSKAQVLVQGIEPSHDTPVIWLCENASHPDQILYVSVLPSPTPLDGQQS